MIGRIHQSPSQSQSRRGVTGPFVKRQFIMIDGFAGEAVPAQEVRQRRLGNRIVGCNRNRLAEVFFRRFGIAVSIRYCGAKHERRDVVRVPTQKPAERTRCLGEAIRGGISPGERFEYGLLFGMIAANGGLQRIFVAAKITLLHSEQDPLQPTGFGRPSSRIKGRVEAFSVGIISAPPRGLGSQ